MIDEDCAEDWAAAIIGASASLVGSLQAVPEDSRLHEAGLRLLAAGAALIEQSLAPPLKPSPLTSFKGGKEKPAS